MKKFNIQVSLFGKHPSSSEYLYIGETSGFVKSIIDWIKAGFEALLKTRQKYLSDRVQNFYFFNKNMNSYVCGTIKLSKDSKGREYPLVILVEIHNLLTQQIEYFYDIWKKNLDILKTKQNLQELKEILHKYKVIENESCRNNTFQEIDTKILCLFTDEDFSKTKLFYKPLQIDDFITIMR